MVYKLQALAVTENWADLRESWRCLERLSFLLFEKRCRRQCIKDYRPDSQLGVSTMI